VRVAETAASLAAVYGVDVERARLAGVLHDWHRETDRGELRERSERIGIVVSPVDEVVPYLLHGPLAAAELPAEFPGIDEDILAAIASHTFGAPVMSPLQKVIYIADVIEPDRRYAPIADLRSAVGDVDLDELFARTYLVSLGHILQRRRPLHPATAAVYNAHVAGVGA
jgi:predicted HD superfamily hydrolase involved in NAD metabolism